MKIILTKQEREMFRKMGARGGKKSAEGMTPEERKERAKKAAATRWGKRK